MTRLLVAGAVLAAGLFSTLAAAAAPGRAGASLARHHKAAKASSDNSLSYGGAGSSSGLDTNLSPPAAVPSPDYQYTSPPVVSGGS